VTAYRDYAALRVRAERGVAFVTIDHPPINLFDARLIGEMARLGDELAADEGVRAVVIDSANPEFFIAHADVTLIQRLPTDASRRPSEPHVFQLMTERFRTMPKATIALIEGIARGGGSEFVLSCDMRFGALGRAVLAQPEVGLGIIPGGSGTQRLPRLVGRGRALEIVLGCDDIPAEVAERWGYLNRALPPGELRPFVERLAYRIASFPAEAIALAKACVDAAAGSFDDGLIEESWAFTKAIGTEAAKQRMAAFMAAGGQTPDVEHRLSRVVEDLARNPR
jgi:enoyl-CoA hydratase/carnithine racemase